MIEMNDIKVARLRESDEYNMKGLDLYEEKRKMNKPP
jgi:hypothetical protein